MEPQRIKSAIESLLFVSSKPLTVKDFCKFLEAEDAVVRQALAELISEHKTSGIVLLDNNGEHQFATGPDNSGIVKNFLNAELREKLTDATVEVLAIIAYRQPISKAEIEAIRGVNSQYSLRALLMRGIVEKTPNPHDARGFLYQTTTEFLQHMGMVSVKDLPDFETLVSQIKLPETPAAAEVQTFSESTDETPASLSKADEPTVPKQAAEFSVAENIRTLESEKTLAESSEPETAEPAEEESNEDEDDEEDDDDEE